MPQFDFSTFSAQFFWLVVFFLILYRCMSCWIVPKMQDVLQKRWEKTEGKLQKSDMILSHAQTLGQEYQEIIQKARYEAVTLQKETQKKLYLDLLREKNRINNQIIFKIKAEKKRIEKEKRGFLQEIENLSSQLSKNVFDKINQSLFNKTPS